MLSDSWFLSGGLENEAFRPCFRMASAYFEPPRLRRHWFSSEARERVVDGVADDGRPQTKGAVRPGLVVAAAVGVHGEQREATAEGRETQRFVPRRLSFLKLF